MTGVSPIVLRGFGTSIASVATAGYLPSSTPPTPGNGSDEGSMHVGGVRYVGFAGGINVSTGLS